ncbi:MAG TPA: ATP-dependent helicase [Gemmatimonadota bacterium]|jgi:DNA helicase-2/ATP-dependent DNA helicase PcrA
MSVRKFALKRSASGKLLERLDRELNDEQRAAVLAGDGPKLVIAGAGSGKTRTVTYRVAYLLDRGERPDRLLLATFTNKAAGQMTERVQPLAGPGARAIVKGTFHAIGNRVLRRHAARLGYRPGFSILDAEDQEDLIKVCVTEVGVRLQERRFPAPGVLRDLISLAFNTQTPLPELLPARAPHFVDWTAEIVRVAEAYAARKRANDAMDYDDLLGNWLALLRGHEGVRRSEAQRFRYLLVDEYQDTNHVQAEIVELLAHEGHGNLMAVGDDCQAIYAFRGADYDNILRFPERNPGTEIFRLETNYRSTPEILSFTNDAIRANRSQFPKQLRAVHPSGDRPVLIPLTDAYEEAAFACEQILLQRDAGRRLDEMAVLYRAHAHAAILETELVRRDIPYEIRSGTRFFERAHVKDVVAHLKVLGNPRDETAWRRLLLMLPKVGNVRAAHVWRALEAAADPLAAAAADGIAHRLPSGAVPAWLTLLDDLLRLRARAEGDRPDALVEGILTGGYREYLLARYDDPQARLEDLEQLRLFASRYESAEALVADIVLIGELYGQDVREGRESEERLILSSVHQAKGLEWEVVFLIRMCEGSFPSPRALGEAGGEEEERRIFYVATTRARRELFLLYPLLEARARSGLLIRPSRFVLEVDPELYERGVVEVQG